MTLSWTMDKIGPIARSADDCALVMSVIHGPDGHDRTVQPAFFSYEAALDLQTIRIGYIKSAFDAPTLEEIKPASETLSPADRAALEKGRHTSQDNLTRLSYDHRFDLATLDVLCSKLNLTLIPVELSPGLHFGDMIPLIGAEAAAAFDELTLSGRDQLLAGQKPYDWPNLFRRARFLSAVDYIQMQRARSLVIDAMARLFEQVDILVTRSGGAQLLASNLSGNPAVILPNGLRGPDAPIPSVSEEDDQLDNPGGPSTPVSITFLGRLYDDARLLAFADLYQQATGFQKLHPKLT